MVFFNQTVHVFPLVSPFMIIGIRVKVTNNADILLVPLSGHKV